MEGIKPSKTPNTEPPPIPQTSTYVEKTYREIAPGHLDIQNPIEREVVAVHNKPKDSKEDVPPAPLKPKSPDSKKQEPAKPIKHSVESKSESYSSHAPILKHKPARKWSILGYVFASPFFALFGAGWLQYKIIQMGMSATAPLQPYFDKLFAAKKKGHGGGHNKHDDHKEDDHGHGHGHGGGHGGHH
jgi:hypothetical protein